MRRRAGWPKRLRKGSSQPQANAPNLPLQPRPPPRLSPSAEQSAQVTPVPSGRLSGSGLSASHYGRRVARSKRPAGPTSGSGLTPSYWEPPPPAPPVPPLPVCCPARSGCSALLAPAGLLDVVSAPVAAPGPVVLLGATSVDAGPEGAVLGDAPGGADVV